MSAPLASETGEHVAMLMWAATVMAREVELCAGRQPNLDQPTVTYIVEHLKKTAMDYTKFEGLRDVGVVQPG